MLYQTEEDHLFKLIVPNLHIKQSSVPIAQLACQCLWTCHHATSTVISAKSSLLIVMVWMFLLSYAVFSSVNSLNCHVNCNQMQDNIIFNRVFSYTNQILLFFEIWLWSQLWYGFQQYWYVCTWVARHVARSITLPTGDSAPFKGQVLQKLTQAKCSIVISHEQLCSFLWFHQQEIVKTIACFVAGIYLLEASQRYCWFLWAGQETVGLQLPFWRSQSLVMALQSSQILLQNSIFVNQTVSRLQY